MDTPGAKVAPEPMTVPHAVHGRIVEALARAGREEAVTIVFACESGSRAWGFASGDSDYDVRFVYLHPRDWYLSVDVENKPEVIERPMEDHLDLSGWDLRKALRLLRKSNPPLLEWLNSPQIYIQDVPVVTRLRNLIPTYYSPRACWYHYFHMAEGNFREYLRGDVVWLKKYLYVLRPLLAVRWIERDLGIVPMEFDLLLSKAIDEPELARSIRELVARKRSGEELDRGPRIPPISRFIESELERLKHIALPAGEIRKGVENLNEVSRWALETTGRGMT